MGLFKIPEKELADYIRKISSGDEEVLVEFYNNFAKSIYTVIFSYVDSKESAEEVLQDVLMSIVTYGFRKPIKNARAWLFKVIKNASVKKAMEDKKRQSESFSESEYTICDDYVFRMIEESIDQLEALKCLTPTEQNCVFLHVLGGIKLTKVAEILNIPYDRTRNIYYYSIRKLRQYYEREEIYEQQRSDQSFA